MSVWFSLIFLIVALPLLVAGLILIWQGWRGRPDFREPHCKKCDYDLRGLDWLSEKRVCPECGSDLTQSGAVLFGRYKRSPRRMAVGAGTVCLAFLLPVAVVVVGRTLQSRGGVRVRSNQAIIANLASTAVQPWDWQELETRYQADQLSKEEVAAAIEQLIIHLKNRPAGQHGPLPWLDSFFKLAMSRKAISQEQLARLCDSFYGSTPEMRMRSRVRQGKKLAFQFPGRHGELPGTMSVTALRSIGVDGQPVKVKLKYAPDSNIHYHSGRLHHSLEGEIENNLAPGKHEVRFVYDWGLLDEKAKLDPRYNGRPGQASRWPTALVKRELTVKLPLEIVPTDVPAVTLITDPKRDPTKEISVTSIQVIPRNQKLELKPQIDFKQSQTPVYFRICLEFDRKKHDLGSQGKDAYWSVSGGHGTIDSLPSDLKAVTVILEPNVEGAEEYLLFNEIWGQPITIRNVPLERYDLEEDTPENPGG